MRRSITVNQPLVLKYHGHKTPNSLDTQGIHSGDQQNAIDSFVQEITSHESRKLQLTFEEPLIINDKSIADKTTSLIEKFFNQDTAQNITNNAHTISSVKFTGYDFGNTTLVVLKPRKRRSFVDAISEAASGKSENPSERKTAIQGLMDFIAQFPGIETLELSDCNVGKEELETILNSQVRPKNIRISSILTNANGVNQDLTTDVLREIGSDLEGVNIQISPVPKQSFHYHGEGTVSNFNNARGDQQAALTQLNNLLQLKSTRLHSLTFEKPNLHDNLKGYGKSIGDKTKALARKLLSGRSTDFENLRGSQVAENLEHLKFSDYDFRTTANSKIINRIPAEGENLRFLIDFLKQAKNLKSLDLSGNNLAIKEINCLLSNLVKLKKENGLQIEEIILDGNCISCEGERLLSDGKAVNNTSNIYQNFYNYKEFFESERVNLSLSQTRKMSSAEISTASSFDVTEGKPNNLQDEITETLTIDGNNPPFNTPEGIEQFFKENKDASKALENLEISNLHFTQNDLFAFTKFLANAETLQNLVMTNNNFEWQDIRDILGSITSEKNVTIDISEETDKHDEKITIDRLRRFTKPNFQSTRVRMGDVDLSWPKREDAKEAAKTNLQQLAKQALEFEEEVDEIIPEPQKKSLNDQEALEAIQKLIEQSGEHKETLLSVFESLVEKSKSLDRAANLIQENNDLFDPPVQVSNPTATPMQENARELE